MKDKLSKNELAETTYQILSRNFNVNEFLKGINYPTLNTFLQDETEINGIIMNAYIFNFWIIMLSIHKILPNISNEIRNSCIRLWWNRGKLEDTYKNLENLMLTINSDFNKYDDAMADKKDPIFTLSKTCLEHLFKKETSDVRATMYVSSHFNETLKAYDKVFSKISIKDLP